MELTLEEKMLSAAKQQILLHKAKYIKTQQECTDAKKWCDNRVKMLDDLYNIAVKLDAREISSNIVIDNLSLLTWDEVCDLGIDILRGLKEPWKESR